MVGGFQSGVVVSLSEKMSGAAELLLSMRLVGMPIKEAHQAVRNSGFRGKIISARLEGPVPSRQEVGAGPVVVLQFEQRSNENDAAGFPVFRVSAAFRLY